MASKIQEQIDYMVKNGIPLPMEIKIAIDQNSKRILTIKESDADNVPNCNQNAE